MDKIRLEARIGFFGSAYTSWFAWGERVFADGDW